MFSSEIRCHECFIRLPLPWLAPHIHLLLDQFYSGRQGLEVRRHAEQLILQVALLPDPPDVVGAEARDTRVAEQALVGDY